MKETRKSVLKIVLRFISLSFFIGCVVAISWWIDLNGDDFKYTEPANYVDPNKTICEVHGEILQIEIVSRGSLVNPNDPKLFPYSNKWDANWCGNSPNEAIVQFCEKCRKAEFFTRQREELEKDLKAHNLWQELPQHYSMKKERSKPL